MDSKRERYDFIDGRVREGAFVVFRGRVETASEQNIAGEASGVSSDDGSGGLMSSPGRGQRWFLRGVGFLFSSEGESVSWLRVVYS